MKKAANAKQSPKGKVPSLRCRVSGWGIGSDGKAVYVDWHDLPMKSQTKAAKKPKRKAG